MWYILLGSLLSRNFMVGGVIKKGMILKGLNKYRKFFKIIFRPFCLIVGHKYEVFMIDSHWDSETNYENTYQIIKCARCSKCKKIKTK